MELKYGLQFNVFSVQNQHFRELLSDVVLADIADAITIIKKQEHTCFFW